MLLVALLSWHVQTDPSMTVTSVIFSVFTSFVHARLYFLSTVVAREQCVPFIVKHTFVGTGFWTKHKELFCKVLFRKVSFPKVSFPKVSFPKLSFHK